MINPHLDDYRTAGCRAATERIVRLCDGGARVLGLGGGPISIHPRIINLNIAVFEHVQVQGDAHHLPFADASFDGVHCEAVFEHLQDPADAAAELFRVLKPGALGYVCTPFMQPFHGSPSHFQNFTIEGHRRLVERAGFTVIECGVGVGPSWALADAIGTYLTHYTPRWLRLPARAAGSVIGRFMLRPLDRWLTRHPDAQVMASNTYVLFSKPSPSA